MVNGELGQVRQDKWALSHLPLVNKRQREEKESKQKTIQEFPLQAGEFIQPSSPREPHSNCKPVRVSPNAGQRSCQLLTLKLTTRRLKQALHNCTSELLQA